MVSYIPAVAFRHNFIIGRVLCRRFPLFWRTPEGCIYISTLSYGSNDSVDSLPCFGKSRIRLRMLWRCLGIDELADIREKHHIADCGCNRIQRAETHYPFYHFENGVDGVFIYHIVCLCTLFLLLGVFAGAGFQAL